MYQQLTFASKEEFRKWLDLNHGTCEGVWLVFGKSGGPETLSYDEALREALCFGWIDGQVKRIDEVKYLRKLTPRRKRSIWSERNKGIAAELIDQGLMMPAGHAAIKRAKKEGMWDKSDNNSPAAANVQVMIDALSGRQPALSNFMNMPLSVRKTYTAFYLDAKKEETRIKRLEKIVERLNQNLKPM